MQLLLDLFEMKTFMNFLKKGNSLSTNTRKKASKIIEATEKVKTEQLTKQVKEEIHKQEKRKKEKY